LSSIHEHQLDTLIHRGVTSEVWRATRLGPNGFAVPVALKTLNEGCLGAQEQVRGFLKEARAASSVQHHNVIQVRELMFESGRYWLSMDLVAGWSMRALLTAIDLSGQRTPIPVALSLVRDAARGLGAIHDAGLLHRAITPDNLMIASAGHVIVLDFGLAIWQHGQRIQYTPPIDVLDPDYSSPDLRARLPVDARTDVYSLGVLLDKLVPERHDVPVALDAIIRRAIDPDAARRFPSAPALEVALDLVSLRESWLVPPAVVSTYLNDVFRAMAAEAATQRAEPGWAPGDADITSPMTRAAPPQRTVLPRGPGGMVGVGALAPANDLTMLEHDLAMLDLPLDE
jgi:eukaryotic-like serine/threonine-protein kinase